MEISEFNSITEQHLTLLLEADPAEKIVRDYTKRGTAFELRQEGKNWQGLSCYCRHGRKPLKS